MVPDGFSQPASHAFHIVPASLGAVGAFRAAIINPLTHTEHCGRLNYRCSTAGRPLGDTPDHLPRQ
jgi:hypothetical protein